ncbi:DJ-1/PfpI family protein [Neptunomonas japonica]|uniref:DJ-1/PfpI family protein n=1 Tax=Neptunomonas japonica TaxID=417574 RepID=UPI0003FE39B5|nr:DJ-1/PfpI family protein [Neptunomonas japonica]
MKNYIQKRHNLIWQSILVCLLLTLNIHAHAANAKIGIIVYDGVLTSDVTAPIEVFGAASKKSWFSEYEVVVVSATKNKTIKTEEGLVITADKTIYDPLTLDVVIVASSYDMDSVINNKKLITFVETQHRQASWMASNCSGALILAEAGVLDGKKATTWAGGEKDFASAYPKVKVQFDQNVVIDDGVLTSNGGPVSYQAAFSLLEKLSSENFSKEISELIQFNRLETAF